MKTLIGLILFSLAFPCMAHDGHGNGLFSGIWHYLTEPGHLLVLVLSIGIVASWLSMLRRKAHQS